MTASTWFSPDWNSAAVCFFSSLCAWLLLRVPSDATAVAWWHKHGLKFFPKWMTTSPQRLISFVFWHSMFWTMNMPVTRYLSGFWSHSEHTPQDIAAAVGHLTDTTPSGIANDTAAATSGLPEQFYDTEYEPYAELAFSLHLTFGVLWLVTSYITLVWLGHGSKLSERRVSSRVTGYIAFTSLCAHVAAGLFQVYVDLVHHKPLNKIVLSTSGLFVLTSAIKAVRLAKRGRLTDHQDAMIYTFLLSATGAGNIRQIGFVQTVLGVGPASCLEDAGVSIVRWNICQCVFPYFLRMCLIGLWTSIMHGAYAASCSRPSVTRVWWSELKVRLVGCLFALGLSYVPGAVTAIDLVMGAERSAQGAALTLLALAAVAYQELVRNEGNQSTPTSKQNPSPSKTISGAAPRARFLVAASFLSSFSPLVSSPRLKYHSCGSDTTASSHLPSTASLLWPRTKQS